ncbi:MAG: hypothetical protein ABF333_13725 [Akkermansiaceae bacterium]
MKSFLRWAVIFLGLQLSVSAQNNKAALPVVEIIFFSPKDIDPPKDAAEVLGRVAVATEGFFEKEMKKRDYPIKRKEIFARDKEGEIKVSYVRGEENAATGKYDRNYNGLPGEIIKEASKPAKYSKNGNCYWIFVYLGTEREFNGWVGYGTIKRGGFGIVRYQPGDTLLKAKTRIHELGHSLTLPHIGPKVSDVGDCSLMGPNEPTYTRKIGKLWDSYYLSESAAARLWHHPLFSGTLSKRGQQAKRVGLAEKSVVYDAEKKLFLVKGQVDCDLPVHSVIVHDESSGPNQEYWRKTYVGRVDGTGGFSIEVDELSDHKGILRFFFCVEGGQTSSCKESVIYDFGKDGHTVQGFIPHSFPLACGGVKKIVSAEWGTTMRHRQGKASDVKGIIEKQTKNGAVSMNIDYKILGDPDPGRTKYLKVSYLLEGEEKERKFEGWAKDYLILPPLELAKPLKKK